MRTEHFDRIAADIADTFHISTAELLSTDKHRETADARHCLAWALREAGLSYPSIGARIGRDHTTAIHAVRRVEHTPTLLRIAQGLAARHIGRAVAC